MLKQYLTSLAFKVLLAKNAPSQFLYLDAFSGPWEAQGDAFEDTSFAIALQVLSVVQKRVNEGDNPPKIRAIFVEQNKSAYERLRLEISKFTSIDADAFNGNFEELVPTVSGRLSKDTFLFAFIDPIGWKGMSLKKISPLISHRRSEVLINVMTNSLSRHAEYDSVQESVDSFFGDSEWRRELPALQARLGQRDDAIVELYLRRLKASCSFSYVGSTRIRNPDADRTYFHLAYGTRHPAGMTVFRDCEDHCVEVQERVAQDALLAKNERQHGMPDLFQGERNAGLDAFKRWRDAARKAARQQFDEWLAGGTSSRASHLQADLMQHRHVTKNLINGWVKEAIKSGQMTESGESKSSLVWHPSSLNSKRL
jgi:three-Cys-motif partner protein